MDYKFTDEDFAELATDMMAESCRTKLIVFVYCDKEDEDHELALACMSLDDAKKDAAKVLKAWHGADGGIETVYCSAVSLDKGSHEEHEFQVTVKDL